MKKRDWVLGILLTAGVSAFATDYSSWAHYKRIGLNSNIAGVTTSGTVASHFPVLVRLSAGNAADVFAGAATNGSDIRFTLSDGATDVPYEIERWDKTNQTASIWVSAPVVVGASDAAAAFKMYWGKASQTTTGKGAAVFDTANGYLAAFHLNETTGDTARDATANRFRGIPLGAAGGIAPEDTLAADGNYIAGHFKKFWTGYSVNSGASYRVVTPEINSTASGKLSFISSTDTYTLSAWVYPDSLPVSNVDRCGVISKSDGVTYSNYHIRVLETQPGNVQFSDGNGSQGSPSASVGSALTVGSWQHIVVTRSGPPGNGSNSTIYLNGVGYNGTNGANVSTENASDVYIGSFSNLTGFFSGKMDEIEISGTARSADWNLLSYQTQKPGTTAVIVGPTDAPLPVISGKNGSGSGFSISRSGKGMTFRFVPLPGSSGTTVSILDVSGREVWRRNVAAGLAQLTWNGGPEEGAMAAGVYLVRAKALGSTRILASAKIILSL